MARPREEVICGRDKKCGQRASEAGQRAREDETERGEGPRGRAAILGSQGRPRVRLRTPAWPPGPRPSCRGEAEPAVPGGLLRGAAAAAAAAAPLEAEAARRVYNRAAAAAAGGRSEGDTVPPAATQSSPSQDPAAAPGLSAAPGLAEPTASCSNLL